jgi:hypothetical protein
VREVREFEFSAGGLFVDDGDELESTHLLHENAGSVLDTACEGHGGDEAAENEILKLRRHLAKMALDSLMFLHWAVDGPAFSLYEWQVGAIGLTSSILGLRMKLQAYQAKTIKSA